MKKTGDWIVVDFNETFFRNFEMKFIEKNQFTLGCRSSSGWRPFLDRFNLYWKTVEIFL